MADVSVEDFLQDKPMRILTMVWIVFLAVNSSGQEQAKKNTDESDLATRVPADLLSFPIVDTGQVV